MSNSPLPIIAVGALGLSSISCVISSLTGFLVSDDSNVESNTSTSNTNTDTSNTSTSNTSTSNTSTSNTYTISHQISLGTDGWCIGTDSVHQDVPGCGRICSSATNVGSKTDGTWGPWDDTTIPCTGAKLDEIWEKQDDGTRKLADGYTLSNYPAGTSVKCGKNDLRSDNNSVYRVSENGKLRHYPNPTIAASWDSNWVESKTIGDCEGLTLGDDLELKSVDGGSGSGSSPGSSGTNSDSSSNDVYHCILDTAKKDGFPGDWDWFLDSFIKGCATNLGENHSEETCLNVKHGHYPISGDPVFTKYCKWELKTN